MQSLREETKVYKFRTPFLPVMLLKLYISKEEI